MTAVLQRAVHDNVAALRQGIELFSRLSSESYTMRTPVCFNSSAGGHLRHVIEHYLSFLQGVESGLVDYEARARDSLIETDPGYALAQLEGIIGRLETFGTDRELLVRSECAPTENSGSSILRELEFLLSHTVHHYALIGVICQLAGEKLPKDFGMAPSTLRHLKAQITASIACAR